MNKHTFPRPLGYKIPQELWSGKTQDYGKLWMFGCEDYVVVPKDDRWKLQSRSRKCNFLGYEPDGSFDYKLWDLETSADVVFNESNMHKVAEHPIELCSDVFRCDSY